MRPLTTTTLILVGLTGLAQIVLGVLFWTGHALALIPLHTRVGYAFVILLWGLTALAARAGAAPGLAAFTFLWGLAVAVVGMLQARWLPGELHWVIRVLHLLIGLVALRLAGMLVAGTAPARELSLEPSNRGAV
jgi:hypothetical protein